ncbi:MAG TPA: hydantoinase B/oxoprolinase family protein, partial [Acidimicrobiales bacterium]|nr:hydantoinase B/oxoprolinase family protein [Acidimicrobiales bacterium]
PQWIVVEPTAGGWGGNPGADGESALINLTNRSFKNIPVEVYESKFPVRIERFAIRTDSGGPGRHRGGCGVIRSFRLLEDASVSVWFERSVTPAWGLSGGGHGAGPAVHADGPAGPWAALKANCVAMPAGTLVTIETGGGGGYGPALERAADEVARDVRQHYVSIEGAANDYSVVVDPVTLEVDEEATRLRRDGEAARPRRGPAQPQATAPAPALPEAPDPAPAQAT